MTGGAAGPLISWRWRQGTNDTVPIWDAKTGRLDRRLSGHESNIFCMLLSRDGRQLASASADHTMRLWPVESLPRLR